MAFTRYLSLNLVRARARARKVRRTYTGKIQMQTKIDMYEKKKKKKSIDDIFFSF